MPQAVQQPPHRTGRLEPDRFAVVRLGGVESLGTFPAPMATDRAAVARCGGTGECPAAIRVDGRCIYQEAGLCIDPARAVELVRWLQSVAVHRPAP